MKWLASDLPVLVFSYLAVWTWTERLSWLAAIIAIFPLLAAAGRRTWRDQRRSLAPGAIRPSAADLIRVPVDQPGGAIRGHPGVYGRDALLKQLSGITPRWRPRPRPTVWVLHGLGGSGKTTVAWAAARRAQKHGVHVWWISASEATRLSAGMRWLSEAAGGSPDVIDVAWADDMTAAALVWRLLNAYPYRWLLVLDAADHVDVLTIHNSPLADGHGWLQPVVSPRGGVLVTSRDGNPEHFGSWCRMTAVPMLHRSAGARYLLELTGPRSGTVADAATLTDRLGGLPLALRLAGSYLASASRTGLPGDVVMMGDFLRTLDPPGSVQTRRPEAALLENLRKVWERSLDRLVRPAHTLLGLLATFAGSPVPLAVLVSSRLASSSLFADVDVASVRAAIESLVDLGMIDVNGLEEAPSQDLIQVASLHPLVRDAARLSVAGAYREYLDLAVDLLFALTIGERASVGTEDPRSWTFWQSIEPHAAYLWNQVCQVFGPAPQMARNSAYVAVQAGRSLRARGMYGQAAIELRRVRDESLRLFGEEDPISLSARFNLARALRDQGNYDEAESEFEKVRRGAEGCPGEVGALILSARHERARVLHAKGRLGDAEAELNGVLAASRKKFGEQNSLTLAAHYELARVLFTREQWKDSLEHFTLVYEAEKSLLGDEHPDTLNAQHQASRVSMSVGDLATAERNMAQVLAVRLRLMGPGHPSTLAARHDLARIYLRKAELRAAEREFQVVVGIRSQTIGAEHPETLAARFDLATVLARRGRIARATQELRHVLESRARVLGSDHPSTTRTRAALNELTSMRGGDSPKDQRRARRPRL